ncbi:hypothetical protein [Variovorax saccharolyticus]|uniref:hypothetical protein n=1 Tax=Variovorax saccharolyticus TaxID=3053516 RepID=UPI002576E677|nr:hypothetical protein [Variovorax sp. J31P216]MDM0029837.1 hypothetical protein [Variovorax sp. J31P216]
MTPIGLPAIGVNIASSVIAAPLYGLVFEGAPPEASDLQLRHMTFADWLELEDSDMVLDPRIAEDFATHEHVAVIASADAQAGGDSPPLAERFRAFRLRMPALVSALRLTRPGNLVDPWITAVYAQAPSRLGEFGTPPGVHAEVRREVFMYRQTFFGRSVVNGMRLDAAGWSAALAWLRRIEALLERHGPALNPLIALFCKAFPSCVPSPYAELGPFAGQFLLLETLLGRVEREHRGQSFVARAAAAAAQGGLDGAAARQLLERRAVPLRHQVLHGAGREALRSADGVLDDLLALTRSIFAAYLLWLGRAGSRLSLPEERRAFDDACAQAASSV